MKKTILLLALFVLIITACTAAPKGEVIVYAVAPLSGWQANGG